MVTDVYPVFFMYFVNIQDLLTYNLGELYKLWDEVQHHSAERQMWINELDKQLSKVEDDRIDMVRLDFIARVLCINNDEICSELLVLFTSI